MLTAAHRRAKAATGVLIAAPHRRGIGAAEVSNTTAHRRVIATARVLLTAAHRRAPAAAGVLPTAANRRNVGAAGVSTATAHRRVKVAAAGVVRAAAHRRVIAAAAGVVRAAAHRRVSAAAGVLKTAADRRGKAAIGVLIAAAHRRERTAAGVMNAAAHRGVIATDRIVRHHPRQIQGGDGIRRRRQLLPRAERCEHTVAIGAHPDLQPTIRTGKVRAKIERDAEQAVAHGRGRIGDGVAHLPRAAVRAEQRKGQVVAAIGGIGARGEPALVGEGSALGQNRRNVKVEA